MSFNSDFFAGSLEESEVSKELIIVFGFPVDFGKVNFSRMDNVKNLAIDRARAKGLDFGDIDLE